MKIEQIPTADLIPYARNTRTHSESQVAQIAGSIREFGFTNPILIDNENGIIAGHGRVMAAQKLGLAKVPCIRLGHLTDTQRRAYIIADNKLALNAGWDEEMLALELGELSDLDFDLSLIGFDESELGDLMAETTEGETDPDDVPEPPVDPVTVPGDVWIMGKHRLMCGDSTSVDAVEKLMDGQKADMVFTDPPYGISIVSGSKVGGSNRVESSVFSPVIGDDTIETAVEAIQVIATLGASVEIIWGGNYYASHLTNSSCWIVWDKKNSGNFADAELAWTNQKTAVRLFQHMWNGMVKASEHGQKRVHPTQKPVALAEWCFDEYGKDCQTVIDLFGGSGSTLLACEKKGKSGFLMELSPDYNDVIVTRWQAFTGKQAIHEASGKTFDEMKAAKP
jgi:16S rRNA G966 N2-methylase RsmD